MWLQELGLTTESSAYLRSFSFVRLPEERTVHAVLVSFMWKGLSFRETARISAALERRGELALERNNYWRGDATTF